MQTVFYILIYLSSICNGGWVLTPTWNNGIAEQSCQRSGAEIKVVTSIDDLLEYKNKSIDASFYAIKNEPDKIYKVIVKDGVFTTIEIRIVPIKKRVKKTVEQEWEQIERYEIQ